MGLAAQRVVRIFAVVAVVASNRHEAENIADDVVSDAFLEGADRHHADRLEAIPVSKRCLSPGLRAILPRVALPFHLCAERRVIFQQHAAAGDPAARAEIRIVAPKRLAAALLRVVDTIHLNPVRAGIVPAEQVAQFRWSSLARFVRGPRPGWLSAGPWLNELRPEDSA